jgi:hypothetical protein
MRKIVLFAGISLLAACNSGTKEEVASVAPSHDSAATAATENITYPYTAGYSSKFAIGDPKHAQLILGLWKDWDNGDLSKGKDVFADTVSLYFWDGTNMHASRDSCIASAQKFRNTYASVSSRVDAFIPLKSTDKDESWVAIWGMETHTDKKGKVDSINLHEVWRINKDGKTDLVYQFAGLTKPAKK